MAEGDLQSLVTDGVIGGVGSVVIFLPQIVLLFLFIGLLDWIHSVWFACCVLLRLIQIGSPEVSVSI